ncbi:succinyldiaminopimelate desuccinylase [Sulfurimonas denitrificans DSM 1251]|uniref:Succinyl-diaminopimelate desuccinylase n=1 Tax=Sulfurimonas denitrificans (strain ATCC 33889 / DSM 1251) TaxID=326298 RepID=DAPE_SULDN|nr:succinyl-diaminopimelate desuccinylase [Sulfurimonas denitrificans]Q30QK9.1 RecName: Full=Succinyl-diaminopimelate desuccinylase; Short=SDAP desuccinylase; AltName: Full=N-succinyl-LL-2,6-diaminoheptanedioate amidohydrolase [Sulfurimonas denitrificans DSM 1251]ABB44722.1 succinyldiaminopimelate desuccinylase [Sulfurimonas denitrificans DSM 1251]MDD3443417.1 succinyl-diaminopimelate desuccinylase [Sulfurimonas denitrificans]
MKTIELFKFMISAKSQTPDDGGLLDFIQNYLDDFEAIRVDVEGVKNLFLYKKFSQGDHLCFAGHVDVVPAGDGWDSDPYIATERDGYIYGRGAQDMKSGVAAFVQAIKDTKHFNGTLSLLLTSDEEGEGTYGTIEVLNYLRDKSMLPDFAVVAEPTCEMVFGDAIKVGRRGSINGYITLRGKQGHAAYPEKSINPINLIAPKLANMAGVDLDNGDEFFSPSKFVITDIRAGMQVTNVTPNELKMMFNVRNTTLTSQKEIREFVEKNLEDLDYDLRLTQGSYPFKTDTKTKLVKNIDASIEQISGIKPKHSTAGGTSDARHMAPLGIDVIEFGVINDTIHAINERTTKDEVKKLYEVFKHLIDTWK